jgi:glycosyltransferase involved in cell wall biosynthesis
MSETAAPLISVIVRTQNRPHLLQRALASIAAQSYAPVEAVVVNDGGTDVTDVAAPFAERISDGLQLLQHPQAQGRSAAANTGINAARGDWIAFLDDDDFFEPDGLAHLAAFIAWDKDIIYGQVQVLEMDADEQASKKRSVLGEAYHQDGLLLKNLVPICGYLCRRQQALTVGGFDKDFDILEDWDFFYRLTRNQNVHYTQRIVANYCIWGEAHISGKNAAQEQLYRERFFRKHQHAISPAQWARAAEWLLSRLNLEAAQAYADSQQSCDKKMREVQAHYQENAQQLGQTQQKLEQQVLQLQQQSARQLEQNRAEAELRLHQHLRHQQAENDRHWRGRMEGVMRRVCLAMAFDLRAEIIDLPSLGLTVPMKALSGENLSEVTAEFSEVKFPMPVTQGKRLRWAFVYTQTGKVTTLLLRLGTYARVNQCHLHLSLSDLDHPERAPIEAQLIGSHVEDNAYNAFALSQPLPPGRYQADLFSPDTDNGNHLMGVWLSVHFRSTTHMAVPHYRYTAPPRAALEARLSELQHTPLISLIVPVYNPHADHLKACLDSVIAQVYPHWQLCLADDASTEAHVGEILEDYQARYPDRIMLARHTRNQHISATSNTALSLAEGEFIALLDHDDLLTEDALLEIALFINTHAETEYDLIYSDEDKWDERNYCYDEPYFKPDWSPELLRGQMYIGHLGVYRKSLVEQVGAFRLGLEGSQDWDLALRVSEKARAIGHIPKILYHWRKHAASTAANMDSKNYAAKAGLKAVQDALAREGENGVAELVGDASRTLVRYPLPDKEKRPLVSIIIPTKDKAELLKPCLTSVCEKNTYDAWEIIVVDNGSEEGETFALFEEFRARLGDQFRVCEVPGSFNFSRLVNQGVLASRGDLILLLNNDTEVLRPDNWLEEMAGYARRDGIGCVGCKLLYADNTLQHAGLVAGVHDLACHIYRFAPQDIQGYYGNLAVVANFAGTTAASLMIKRSLWDEVGGFDEAIAVAFNDVDFCFKVLSHGQRNIILPHVYFYHYESKSRGSDEAPERRARFLQESRTVKTRWDDMWIKHDPYYNPHLSKDHEDYRLSVTSPYYDADGLFDWRTL